MEEAFPQLI